MSLRNFAPILRPFDGFTHMAAELYPLAPREADMTAAVPMYCTLPAVGETPRLVGVHIVHDLACAVSGELRTGIHDGAKVREAIYALSRYVDRHGYESLCLLCEGGVEGLRAVLGEAPYCAPWTAYVGTYRLCRGQSAIDALVEAESCREVEYTTHVRLSGPDEDIRVELPSSYAHIRRSDLGCMAYAHPIVEARAVEALGWVADYLRDTGALAKIRVGADKAHARVCTLPRDECENIALHRFIYDLCLPGVHAPTWLCDVLLGVTRYAEAGTAWRRRGYTGAAAWEEALLYFEQAEHGLQEAGRAKGCNYEAVRALRDALAPWIDEAREEERAR